MRSHFRTVAILAVAAALVALFLHNVDLRGVVREIAKATLLRRSHKTPA